MTEQQGAPRVHTRDGNDGFSGTEVHRGAEIRGGTDTRRGTETKPSFKTTELIVYALASALVLIAGLIVDGFNATETWRYFTYLTIGYMISRGLAKAGSRYPQDD